MLKLVFKQTLEPDPVNTGVGIGRSKPSSRRTGSLSFTYLDKQDGERTMKKLFTPKLLSTSLAICLSAPALLFAADDAGIEEVIVTSQFREVGALKLANSISVFSQDDIATRGAKNIEQLINIAPNVNYSSGASRGRFFQIRGIGERSQFRDPVTPSVGLIVDEIDFTGLGLAGNTLDVQQVEVLRGPQGTLYGANALAGLITIKSNAPSDEAMAKLSAELADYDSYTVSAVASGPISDALKYRVAIQNQQSDGFIDNDFLDREDTNNIDETIVRTKLQLDATEDLRLSFTGVYLDADNGYDAFSLYNTRTTLSDQPGWDRQESVAASFVAEWSGAESFSLESVVSAANSDTEYGYDEDWTFDGFHPWGYSSVDNYQRERENISVDMRLVSNADHAIFNDSTGWVLGVYYRAEDESLVRKATFTSDFKTDNVAVYGQLHTQLSDKLALVSGLRFEQRDVSYADNLGVNLDTDDNLWGGHITLEYQLSDSLFTYALVSRGYKGGGVNGLIISESVNNPAINESMFAFDKESMLNYELGLKGYWLEQRLQTQIALFYQDRTDAQAKQSIFNPSDFSFDDFLTNASGGSSIGLELTADYSVSDRLSLFASLGLLNAEFDDFMSSSHVDARDDNNGLALAAVDMDGRDVAHAPNYQFSLGGDVVLVENLTLRIEVEGKDEFYYSNSHNEKSSSYELINMRLTYQGESWDVALWGRNLTDKEVRTRGFYFSNAFGNNPANGYAAETYYQLAEPRVVGVTASYSF
jgi:outer membrane receptor protein involved in Fe transport